MSTDRTDRILGIILAGGLSRRMGGGDKGLARLGGTSLLERIVARVRPQVSRVVLNANGDPARFAGLGLDVVADTVEGNPGPLAGVLTGLDHAGGRFDHVLAVPCDAPFLPHDLAIRLAAASPPGGGAVAASGGRRHPAVALWPAGARAALREALVDREIRRVDAVERELGFAEAHWPVEPFDLFLNVNDATGLDEAEAVLERFPAA